MGTLVQHSHTITAPLVQSLCARTTHELDSILAQAKSEELSLGGRMINWGGSKVNHCYPELEEACYRYGNNLTTLSDHHSTFSTIMMLEPLSRIRQYFCSSQISGVHSGGENDQLRWKGARSLLPRAGRGLVYVWKQSDNTIRPSQQPFPYNYCVLETHTN